MDRLSRDTDEQYSRRRNENDTTFGRRYEEDDTYNQTRTENRLPSRQNYDRQNRNNYYTATRQRLDDDQLTGDRRFRENPSEEKRVRVDVPYKSPSRINVDNNQDVHPRTSPPNQTQRPPRVEYTVNQAPSGNRRSFVIDINISVSLGGRNPQVIASTNTIPLRSSPIRSTAIIEDVGYIDLDLRSPERTARLATDGLIRSSPSRQTTNENEK